MRRVCLCLISLSIVLVGIGSYAETDTVLIVYTNDLHDHVRAGYNGLGGMPYVSGYIKSVCAERTDTVVLDAGDVMEKGDLLAAKTESAVMYTTMRRAGYQAGVPGNHDFAYGLDRLRKNAELGGFPLLCANYIQQSGSPHFTPSTIIDVDGVKVGIIGVTRMASNEQKQNVERPMDFTETVRAVAEEARRLDKQAHLVVVLAHLGSQDCSAISRQVPAVDVFVSGHTHEIIKRPKVVKETGAIIVQAGDYAKYVGRLELSIDLETEEVVKHDGELVAMRHDTIPCDEQMREWIRKRELEVCPEAARVVGRSTKIISPGDVALLYAEAVRRATGADVGLSRVRVIRGVLPEGDVDVNAVVQTFVPSGRDVVTTTLTGRELLEHIQWDNDDHRLRALWTGCQAEVDFGKPFGSRVLSSNIEPYRTYRVALSQDEWERTIERQFTGDKDRVPAPNGITTVEALANFLERVTQEGITIDGKVDQLLQQHRAAPATSATH